VERLRFDPPADHARVINDFIVLQVLPLPGSVTVMVDRFVTVWFRTPHQSPRDLTVVTAPLGYPLLYPPRTSNFKYSTFVCSCLFIALLLLFITIFLFLFVFCCVCLPCVLFRRYCRLLMNKVLCDR